MLTAHAKLEPCVTPSLTSITGPAVRAGQPRSSHTPYTGGTPRYIPGGNA